MKLTTTCLAALAAIAGGGQAAELRLSGPYTHENLSIYLVHGQDRVNKTYLTLADAIAQRKAVVSETGSVNQLQIDNHGDIDIYIQSGDIVKGGKQDRVLKDDIIIPAGAKKVDLSAFCVEHGRWTKRGEESAQAFGASANAVATPAMKRAVRVDADQSKVWEKVAEQQDTLNANLGVRVNARESASSYQLSMEAPAVRQRAGAFRTALAGVAAQQADALGYVMAVNGKVTGADVYATHALFVKMWPKMLDAAAVEAMAAARPGAKFNAPPLEDVRAAATGYGARVTHDRDVNLRTNGVKAELPQGTVFETKDKAAPSAPLHRSYVVK